MTKIGEKKLRPIRVRGGKSKNRALRLDAGVFSWGSQAIARKVRISKVVYNATSNELVRTNTLVKGCVISIEAAPFRQWYETRYGMPINSDSKSEESAPDAEVEDNVKNMFKSGRLFAVISSRPGQCGRADGYILEGEELAFYLSKIHKKH